jgi:hypothetical protein
MIVWLTMKGRYEKGKVAGERYRRDANTAGGVRERPQMTRSVPTYSLERLVTVTAFG